MKKLLIYIFLLCSLSAFAQNNIKKTAGINYTQGAPTFTPDERTASEIAIDTVTGFVYQWHRTAGPSNFGGWRVLGQGIDVRVDAVPPNYVPFRNQSVFVVNAVDSLYYYHSGSWHHLNKGGGGGGGGSTYTAGTGIAISGGNVISNTAPDKTVSITGGGINSVSGTYPNFTVTGTEVDGSTTNELNSSLSVTGGNLRLTDAGGNKDVAVTDIAPIQALTAGSGISISGAGSNKTITATGGGGSGVDSTLANNGVSLSGKTVQLGNTVGATTANFTTDREIPTNSNKLIVSGLTKSAQFRGISANNYVQISPDSTSGTGAMVQFKIPSSTSGQTIGIMRIDPPTKNVAQSPYYFGISNTAQTGVDGNNVYMQGWNLGPGGSKLESGKPAIGFSMEQNYRPSAPTAYPRYIEYHDFYIPSYSNTQRRLMSYTITEGATGNNNISLYNTVDQLSLRDTSGSDYMTFSGNQSGSAKSATMSFIAGTKSAQWNFDNNNNIFQLNNTSSSGDKAGSILSFSGFREFNMVNHLSRSCWRVISYAGYNDVFWGSKSYPTETFFQTSEIASGFGIYFEGDANTSTNLTGRGNTFIKSGSNQFAVGQRSDINMGYIGTSGSFSLRVNALQVGPLAGSALPTGTTFQVNSNAANTQSLVRLQTTTDSIRFFVHGATPESSTTGRIGDISIGKVSGTGSIYVKTSGENTNTGWKQVATGIATGSTTATTSAAGKLTITHGLGAAPSVVTATYIGDNAYFCTITNKGATTFDVKVWDASGAAVASTSVTVDWISR